MWNSKLYQAITRQIKQKKKHQAPQPLLTEPINDEDISQFEAEQAGRNFGNHLLTQIRDEYHAKESGQPTGGAFHFINQRGIVGFALDAKRYKHGLQDWRHFQVFCSQRILDLGYVMRVKQIETQTCMDNLTSTYRYYLKPSIKGMKSLPMDQLYGNVSIELVLQNSEVFRFIFRTNYYSDRNYQEVRDFKELLHLMIQE